MSRHRSARRLAGAARLLPLLLLLAPARAAASGLTLSASPAHATGSAGKSVRIKVSACVSGCGQQQGDAAPSAPAGACAPGCHPPSVAVALAANSTTGSLAAQVECNPAARLSGSLNSIACRAGTARTLTGSAIIVPLGPGGVGEFTVSSSATGTSALTVSAAAPAARGGGDDDAAAAVASAEVVVSWGEPGPAKVLLQAREPELHWRQPATVSALVLDAGRAPLRGVPVAFSVVGACKPAPTLSQELAVSDEWGRAVATVRSSAPCEAAVIATARSRSAAVMSTKAAASNALASAPAHVAFLDDEALEALEAQRREQQELQALQAPRAELQQADETRAPPLERARFEAEPPEEERRRPAPRGMMRGGPAEEEEQEQERAAMLARRSRQDADGRDDRRGEEAAAREYARRYAALMADDGGGGLRLQQVAKPPAAKAPAAKSPPAPPAAVESRTARLDTEEQLEAELDAELSTLLKGFGFKQTPQS